MPITRRKARLKFAASLKEVGCHLGDAVWRGHQRAGALEAHLLRKIAELQAHLLEVAVDGACRDAGMPGQVVERRQVALRLAQHHAHVVAPALVAGGRALADRGAALVDIFDHARVGERQWPVEQVGAHDDAQARQRGRVEGKRTGASAS
jgi:hypothetical protein